MGLRASATALFMPQRATAARSEILTFEICYRVVAGPLESAEFRANFSNRAIFLCLQEAAFSTYPTNILCVQPGMGPIQLTYLVVRLSVANARCAA